MPRLTINGQPHEIDVDPDTPLLWVLRDGLGLTGTKYGCGIAECGACTVHVDGVATRSCSIPVGTAEGTQITTIEGLSASGDLHPVQRAWIAHDEANIPSGGRHTDVEIGDFLSGGRRNPEHQALLYLIGTLVEGAPRARGT